MCKIVKRLASAIVALIICLGITSTAVAVSYIDSYPDTHRNSGQNIADLIAVARTQLGYTELSTSTGYPISSSQDGGYTKYGASFGDATGPWCAYFISWCASKAGISSSIVPRIGNCNAAINWFKNRTRFYYRSTGYTPKTGDLIFYNWSGSSASAQHVGIVTGVSGSNIYTIEGNTDSSYGYRCAAKTRSRTASYVVGYANPNYNDSSTYIGSYSFASSVAGSGASHSDSIAYSTSKLSIVTTSATGITSSNAILNGSVTNAGYLNISAAGFFFGKDKNTLKKNITHGSTSKKNITLSMDVKSKSGKLEANTTYYYRAFATIDGRDYVGPMYAVITVDDQPQQLILSENEINVGIGQTSELMAAQLPLGSRDEGVTWTSSDEKIAKVNSNGVVMGVGFGAVTITARTNYGAISAKCEVDVLISAPQDIQLINTAVNEITVQWQPVDGATGYVLYRADDPDSEFKEYKTIDAKQSSFVDEDVKTGNRYYYRMRTTAKLEKYNSDITDTMYTTARLPAPEITDIHQIGTGAIELAWEDVPDAERYSVYRSRNIDGLYSLVAVTSQTNLSDTNLAAGSYFYKVVADNSEKNAMSDYSSIVGSGVEFNESFIAADPIIKIVTNIVSGKHHEIRKKEERTVTSDRTIGITDSTLQSGLIV